MAERKSGPVKPPVIDLTAKPARPRPAQASAAADQAEAETVAAPAADPAATSSRLAEPPPFASDAGGEAANEPLRPPPPRPLARLAMPWSAISIAAIGGAVLGTILTYVAVNFIALPDNRPVIADPAARLEAQDRAIAELSERLATAEAASQAAEARADAAAAGATNELEALRQQVLAIPAPKEVDLAPLEAQVTSIEDSIAAIAAGASGADATALAETISRLEAGLGELRAALGALTQRTSAAEAAIAAVRGEVDATKSAVAAQTSMIGTSDIGPAVRLPLMVSGVESAFANGRPFDAELNALTTLLPDLAVPETIRTAASAGLPRPDAVATAFTDTVPAILAGRTAEGSGDLTQDAIEWAKGLLALRPLDETEGQTPEAIVSRLEAAVARRDFASAAALLGQLPEPMQAAAGPVGTDIRTLAAADGFVATLRARALQAPAAEAPVMEEPTVAAPTAAEEPAAATPATETPSEPPAAQPPAADTPAPEAPAPEAPAAEATP